MLRLSDLLGSNVRSVEGETVGRLIDLSVTLGADHPAVRRLAIGRHRRVRAVVDFAAVLSFEHDNVQLSIPRAQVVPPGGQSRLPEHDLFLARDVLDTQIVDVAGRRLARVSEVLLARSDDTVRVAGVEVGSGGVWRRLGMHRLADRTSTRRSTGPTFTSPRRGAMRCNLQRPAWLSTVSHRSNWPRWWRSFPPRRRRNCLRRSPRRSRPVRSTTRRPTDIDPRLH